MAKPNHSASLRERFNISRIAIAFPWLTLGFWIAISVAGIMAFSSLKYALFPDITFPVVVVNASAPISTAIDTEEKLTKPLENQLKSLQNLDEIRSSTYPGQSAIFLSFSIGTKLEASSRQVETYLKQLPLLKDATLQVIPFNLNESAAISYSLQSITRNLSDLTLIANQEIIPNIAKLPGVLKVVLLGNNQQNISNNSSENSAQEIINTPPTLVRFNGKDALAFQVIKRGDANTLEVVAAVEKEVDRLRGKLSDVQINLAATQAEYIRKATHATIDALIEAIVLSVIVIFPFLWNWRATLISALAIPTSLLGTFIVMAIYGFNLETITLLALALVIGIIIDDAIVDVENISRHLELGESPRQAAIFATNEIGLTVTAATLTAVAVFLPIALMHGVIGQFFKPFGITVAAALLTSLLVSRTLSPVLAVFWLRPQSKHYHSESHFFQGFAPIYRKILHWSLHHRSIVIGLAIISFILGIAIIPLIPKGFIPKLDRGEFNIAYHTPIASLMEKQKKEIASTLIWGDLDFEKIAQESKNNNKKPANNSMPNFLKDSVKVGKKLEEVVLNSPEVKTVFSIVGSREGETNKGNIYIQLKSDRTQHTATIQDKIRQKLPAITDVNISVEDIQFVDTGDQKPLQIALKGDDLKHLSQTAKLIKENIEKLPGFADVSTTSATNELDNIFQVDRLNNQRVAYITANLSKDVSLGNATDKVVSVAKAIMPPEISLDLGGDSARIGEVFGSFASTLLMSVLCIIIVLILLFKSWIDPLVIGVSLPLSLIGAMLALYLTKSDFGMISLIGFIFLLGLTNKNAILLVDYINQLRNTGINRNDAILQAGPIRLRPILMTTAATILGMVPIALGWGAGAELRSPMAIAITGGLITSTILSLIVVPVVYSLLDDLFPRFQKKAQ